jgi:hypothetical protein
MGNHSGSVVVARRAPTPSIDIVVSLLFAAVVVVVLFLHVG